VSKSVIVCLHDPANVQHYHVYFEYICWKFAGCLLDRVNTPRSLLEAHGDKSNGDNEKIKQVEETAHE